MIYAWSNKMLFTQYHCGKFSYNKLFQIYTKWFTWEWRRNPKKHIKDLWKWQRHVNPSRLEDFYNCMIYRHEHLKYILFCKNFFDNNTQNVFPIPWYCRFYLSSWFMLRWSTYISCAREFQTVKPQTNFKILNYEIQNMSNHNHASLNLFDLVHGIIAKTIYHFVTFCTF